MLWKNTKHFSDKKYNDLILKQVFYILFNFLHKFVTNYVNCFNVL